MTQHLPLTEINTSGGTQPRAALNEEVLADYTEHWKSGGEFPPVEVVYDGKTYWLWDGFHRVESGRQAEVEAIPVLVTQGDKALAQWLSYSANKNNGLRRANEEKQQAVKHALLHPQAKGLSDRKIAEHVGVHHSTIAEWRKKLEPSANGRTESEPVGGIRHVKSADINKNEDVQDSTAPEKRLGRDGKQYDMEKRATANKAQLKSRALSPEAADDLRDILHMKPGADDRWQRCADIGLSDHELLDAIVGEIETQGTHEGISGGVEYRGGKTPTVVFEHGGAIAGQALVNVVRKVLEIPLPLSAFSLGKTPQNGPDNGPVEFTSPQPADPALNEPLDSKESPPEGILDELGRPLPFDMHETFFSFHMRCEEAKRSLRAAQSALVSIEQRAAEIQTIAGPGLWDVKTAISSLKQVMARVEKSPPYTICVYCKRKEGQQDKCTACDGAGWITKEKYEKAPEEIRPVDSITWGERNAKYRKKSDT